MPPLVGLRLVMVGGRGGGGEGAKAVRSGKE